jgi:hypothetical protein
MAEARRANGKRKKSGVGCAVEAMGDGDGAWKGDCNVGQL